MPRSEIAPTIRQIVSQRPQTWLEVEETLLATIPKANRLWLAFGLQEAIFRKMVRLDCDTHLLTAAV